MEESQTSTKMADYDNGIAYRLCRAWSHPTQATTHCIVAFPAFDFRQYTFVSTFNPVTISNINFIALHCRVIEESTETPKTEEVSDR